MQENQRLINVIRKTVAQQVGSVGASDYRYGVAYSGGGGYETSAYLSGDDLPTEFIRLNAGSYVSPGDYIIAVITEEGDAWVDQILPRSLFARVAIDYNNGRIFLGDGDSEPADPGTSGQVLTSGGPDGSIFWSTP